MPTHLDIRAFRHNEVTLQVQSSAEARPQQTENKTFIKPLHLGNPYGEIPVDIISGK